MSEGALTVVGGVLAGLTFLLMAAIVWFRWCDSRRIL